MRWIYIKKIDLFSEVLEKINKEYVEDVNQSDAMDAAINGVLQSLDPYSAYMSPELFENMQTETSGEFGGLGIEVGMEHGVVKVISPLDNIVKPRLQIMNNAATIDVALVKKFPADLENIKLSWETPMPKAPPSDFCMRTSKTNIAARIILITNNIFSMKLK